MRQNIINGIEVAVGFAFIVAILMIIGYLGLIVLHRIEAWEREVQKMREVCKHRKVIQRKWPLRTSSAICAECGTIIKSTN